MPDLSTADIGYITDIHFTSKKTPKWFGGDSFFKDQLRRFDSFVDKAISKSCKVLLLGGDIFDAHDDFSPSMNNLICKSFSRFPGLILSAIGNHDLYGRALSGLENSAIELLELKCQNFSTESTFVEDVGLIELYHWGCKEEVELQRTKRFWREKEGVPIFGVIHTPVGPEVQEYCIGVEELDVKGFKVLFFGDQHAGWKPVVKNDSILANPSSFSWMNVKEVDTPVKAGFFSIKQNIYWEEVLDLPVKRVFEHTKIKKFIKSVKDFEPATIKQKTHDELIDLVTTKKTYSKEAVECLKSEIAKT